MTEEEKKAIKFIKSELQDEKEARNDYQSLTGLYGNLEIEIILNLIQKQDTEINKLNNVIAKIKNKLEEHIKHCEQEAKGSLNNEICNISLKFDKGLLEIINMGDK